MRTLTLPVLHIVIFVYCFVISLSLQDEGIVTQLPGIAGSVKTVTPLQDVLDESTSLIFEDETTSNINVEATTTTTVLAQEDETSSSLSPTQEAVLAELHDIWQYSLSLSDTTDKELKTTLSNVVQLAYGRVQIEPDETLDRLKYLLEKLRQRIGVSTSSTSTDQYLHTDQHTTEYPSKSHSGKNKRSIGVGEVEVVSASDENSIYSYANPKDNYYQYENYPSAVTPSDKTVQKVLLVQDRVTIPVITNLKTTAKPLLPLSTEPYEKPTPPPTLFYPSLQASFEKFQKNKNSQKAQITLNSTLPESGHPIKNNTPSVEQIANEIVKLLYPTSTTIEPYIESESKKPWEFTFPKDQDLFQHKLNLLKNPPIKNLYTATTTKPSFYPTYLQVHPLPSLNGDGNEGTTTLPPVLLNLIANLKNQSGFIKEYFHNVSSSDAQEEGVTEEAGVMIEKIGGATNENNSTNGVESSTAASTVNQIMVELEQSNILLGPSAIFNGTKDGLVQFITTLSTLSFTTKMVMVFALSISVLSIVLGVYSLGPPIIAVGILGIMIPIAILVLVQDTSRSGSKNPQGKVTLNDQMSFIIDLIDKAVDKYGQYQSS